MRSSRDVDSRDRKWTHVREVVEPDGVLEQPLVLRVARHEFDDALRVAVELVDRARLWRRRLTLVVCYAKLHFVKTRTPEHPGVLASNIFVLHLS